MPRALDDVYPGLEKAYRERRYVDLPERRRWLRSLKEAVCASTDAIYAALAADLHRSPGQTMMAELVPLLGELDYLLGSLGRLMRGRAVNGSPALFFASNRELPMPLGPTLIIVPFNYPLQLALSPAAASIACGNPTAIRMSRATPATAAVVESILSKAGLPRDLLSVISVEDYSRLWVTDAGPRNWAKVFFTGSAEAGRDVAKNAALTFSNVTLELGGSNPLILASSHASAVSRATSTGKRTIDYILFAKYLNAGQTCVSPNYLLVVDSDPHAKIYHTVLQRLADALNSFYCVDKSEKDMGPIEVAMRCEHFCRLITPAAKERVLALVKEAIQAGAEAVAPAGLEQYIHGNEPFASEGDNVPSETPEGGQGGSISQAPEKPTDRSSIGQHHSTTGDAKQLVSRRSKLPLDPERFFPPTILDFGSMLQDSPNATLSDVPPAFLQATRAEIFGPVLPVLRVYSFDQALNLIQTMQPNTQSKPLASYLFTDDGNEARVFKQAIDAGSSVVNCAIMQSACHLPFGGVGTSGIGSYHGHYSFETFSHYKPVLHAKRPWLHFLVRPNLVPPYEGKLPVGLLARVTFVSLPTPGQCWAILGGVLLFATMCALVAWGAVCQSD